MIYADYEFYSGCYYGSINEEDFQRLAVRASSFLDYYTQNRVKDFADLEAVKMCCCALAEAIYSAAVKQQESAGKSSEKVGGYSVSYEGRTQQQAALADEKRRILRLWLGGTGLLYAGVG